MHKECFRYVLQFATHETIRVIEIGSRDVNGSARPLFPCAKYVGIDISPGPGVDCIGDGATWKPDELADLVLCLEVLEHTPNWGEIIANSFTWIVPGGTMVSTCAGPKRQPHSATDGAELRPGEWYRNLTADEIATTLMSAGFIVASCAEVGEDIQAVAYKPKGQICGES